MDTTAYLKHDPQLEELSIFHRILFAALKERQTERNQKEEGRLRKRYAADDSQVRSALWRLSLPLSKKAQKVELRDRDHRPMVAASQMVGDSLGIEIVGPAQSDDPAPSADPCETSPGLPMSVSEKLDRLWLLVAGRTWPVAGVCAREQKPVALIPARTGNYQAHDPVDQSITLITASTAAGLETVRLYLYAHFRTRNWRQKIFCFLLGTEERRPKNR